MAFDPLQKAADATFPLAGEVRFWTATTTSAAVQLLGTGGAFEGYDAAFFDIYLSADCYVLFGGSGVVAASAPASGATCAAKLPAGLYSRALRPGEDYMALLAPTGTVEVRMWPSSRKDGT